MLLLCACGTGLQSAGTKPETAVVLTSSESGSQMRIRDVAAIEGAVPVERERAWAELPHVYAGLGIEVEYADARRFELGNPKLQKRSTLGKERLSTYLRCGIGPSGELADTYRVNMTLRSVLQPADGNSTLLVTELEATATPLFGSTTGTVACSSTGRLEGLIHQALLLRISGAGK